MATDANAPKKEAANEQGSDGSSEITGSPEVSGSVDPNAGTGAVNQGNSVVTPEMLDAVIASNTELKASNDAVIASNTEIVAAIKDFRAGCGEIIEEIVSYGKKQVSGETTEKKSKPVTLNPDAKYVVAKGKRFQDRETGNYHEAGSNVTRMDKERLKNLLSQGIIEEAD